MNDSTPVIDNKRMSDECETLEDRNDAVETAEAKSGREGSRACEADEAGGRVLEPDVSCSSCGTDDQEKEGSRSGRRWKIVSFSLSLSAFSIGLLARYVWQQPGLAIGLLLAAWLLAGYEVIISAGRKLLAGFVLDQDFLMSVATIGAVALGEYTEAALVMILYQIGELLEEFAVGRSRKSISDLMDIAAPYANRVEADGVRRIDPELIQLGDILEVSPGELIPTDGVIISGQSSLNVAAITGESLPLEVAANSKVLSGSINGNGLLRLRAETTYKDSTASRVMMLVEEASSRKAKSESFVTRFARIYTPFVVGLAVLVAVVPPLLFMDQDFATWLYRGLTFLVVSCPCAFVISVPLSFVAGLGMSSRNGVLIRGGNDLENLAALSTLAFDKTGTLTKGKFSVLFSHAEEDVDERKFLALAAALERGSTHPIAESIVKHVSDRSISFTNSGLTDVISLPGHGMRGVLERNNSLSTDIEYPTTVYIGNAALMKLLGLHEKALADGCEGQAWAMSHVAIIPGFKETQSYEEMKKSLPIRNARYLGHIVIRDELKPEAAKTVAALRQSGVDRIALLTGDNKVFAREIAGEAGIDEVHASLLPQDKVAWMEKAKVSVHKGSTGFVGDGLNDAPVLITADVGIAMGGIGSDAAIEAADVVLMTDDLSALPKGLTIARKTKHIARQNIAFALGVKFLFLLLTAIGYMPMWLAVFADVGVTLLVVLNCFRIFYIPRLQKTVPEGKLLTTKE
ncbi:MAG TPA: heavy metal translocating P-type ATPase [Clostridiaceae bacterium]|nr:heavy metal translocating P-type ATPase [Clostridiaceae bacterium]